MPDNGDIAVGDPHDDPRGQKGNKTISVLHDWRYGFCFFFIAIVFYSLFCNDIAFVLGGNLAAISNHMDIALLVYVFGFFGFGVKQRFFRFMMCPAASGTNTCNSAAACSCGC